MQWLYNNDSSAWADKLRATNNADEILSATTGWVNEGLNHPRKDDIVDFARGTVLLRIGQQDYSADVVVGMRKNGSLMLYDVLALQKTSFEKKRRDAAKSANSSPRAARNTASFSKTTLTQKEGEVKQSFSASKEMDEAYLQAQGTVLCVRLFRKKRL